MVTLSRRALLGLAGAGLALTACGGGPAASGPGGAAAEGFPVTVRHSLGETVIEAPPRRVVTLGFSDADVVLALGVQPVGIHSTYDFPSGVGPWAESRLTDPRPVVWGGRIFNYEGIAALGPDVILAVSDSGDRGPYDILSKIAPTVALPAGAVRYSASWQQTTRTIALALGRADQGERLVTDTEAYLARVATDNPGFAGRTLTYLDVYPGGITVGGGQGRVVQMMRGLGFVQPPGLPGLESAKSLTQISPELLGQVDADVMLVYGFGSDLPRLLAANPSLAGLPSVKAGRVHLLPDLSLSSPSVLSIPYGVDRLVPELRRMLG